MHPGQVFRTSIVTAAVLLVAGALLSSCLVLPVPIPAHQNIDTGKLSRVRPGVTTRAEVIALLGPPFHAIGDDRYLVHIGTLSDYGMAVLVIFIVPGKPTVGANVGGAAVGGDVAGVAASGDVVKEYFRVFTTYDDAGVLQSIQVLRFPDTSADQSVPPAQPMHTLEGESIFRTTAMSDDGQLVAGTMQTGAAPHGQVTSGSLADAAVKRAIRSLWDTREWSIASHEDPPVLRLALTEESPGRDHVSLAVIGTRVALGLDSLAVLDQGTSPDIPSREPVSETEAPLVLRAAPDAHRLAVVTRDNLAVLDDAQPGARTDYPSPHKIVAADVAFARADPSKIYAALACDDTPAIRLWSSARPTQFAATAIRLAAGLSASSQAIAITGDGAHVALHNATHVELWDVQWGGAAGPQANFVRLIPFSGADFPTASRIVAFSSDSSLLFAADGSGMVHAWKVADGSEVWRTAALGTAKHPGSVNGIAISADSGRVAVASEQGLRVYATPPALHPPD